MPILRILQVVVGGLFLTALALFAVIALGKGQGEQAVAEAKPDAVPKVSVNHLTDDLEAELLAEKPAGEGLDFVENLIITLTGRAITAVEDAEAEAVLDVATLSREHQLDIKYRVHLSELMPPDIMRIPEVNPELFALGQMGRYVRERECPLLLEDFATACQVLSVDVDAREDKMFEVRAKVAFVAEDPPGEVPLAENLRTISEWFDVYDGRRPLRDAVDHNEVRRLSYAQVARQCAALRQSYGNCIVEEIEARFTPMRNDPQALRAVVRVKVSAVVPQSGS